MFLKHPYKEPLEHRLSILTRNLSFIIVGFLKHPYKEPLEHRLSILTRNLSFIIIVFLKHAYKEFLEHRLSILTRNLSFIIVVFLNHPYKEPLEHRLSILTRNLSSSFYFQSLYHKFILPTINLITSHHTRITHIIWESPIIYKNPPCYIRIPHTI